MSGYYHSTGPPASPFTTVQGSLQPKFMIFNISFSIFFMSTTSWATLHAVPVIPFLSTMTCSINRISLRGSLPSGGRALLQLSPAPPAPGWRVLVLPFRSPQPGRVLQGTDGPINARMGRWLGSMRSRSLALHVIGTTTTTPLRKTTTGRLRGLSQIG
jgi:hypothetical protein